MSDSVRRPHESRGTTHCKERALSDLAFERVLRGAEAIEDDYRSLQARVAVLVLGRLGLRRGELVHLRSDWIDERRQTLTVPRQQGCERGRDGGICGMCHQLAKQRAAVNEGVDLKTATDWQWTAKTDAAARDVYYGHSSRVELAISDFLARFDRWPVSATGVNRRLDAAAEQADGVEPDHVAPHPLRATAATHLAGQGLEMHSLMQHFGWGQPSTAKCYLARNAENTARQLDGVQSM